MNRELYHTDRSHQTIALNKIGFHDVLNSIN